MARPNARATAGAAVSEKSKSVGQARSRVLVPRTRSEQEMEELSEALEAVLREAGVTMHDLLHGLPQACRQVYRLKLLD